MVNDLQKLKVVVDSLEEQARQVSEFSGLLSAVSDARIQIESCKEQLQDITDVNRIFLESTRGDIVLLIKKIDAIEKTLYDLGHMQCSLSEKISLLDMLSLQDLRETLTASEQVVLTAFSGLDNKIDAAVSKQNKDNKKISIILLIVTMIMFSLGVFVLYNSGIVL